MLSKLFQRKQNKKQSSRNAQSHADRLIRMVDQAGVELFHDQFDDSLAYVPVGNHKEIWSLKSKQFKQWLGRLFWQATGKAASSKALSDSLNVLEAQARFEGKRYTIHNGAIFHRHPRWI